MYIVLECIQWVVITSAELQSRNDPDTIVVYEVNNLLYSLFWK